MAQGRWVEENAVLSACWKLLDFLFRSPSPELDLRYHTSERAEGGGAVTKSFLAVGGEQQERPGLEWLSWGSTSVSSCLNAT